MEQLTERQRTLFAAFCAYHPRNGWVFANTIYCHLRRRGDSATEDEIEQELKDLPSQLFQVGWKPSECWVVQLTEPSSVDREHYSLCVSLTQEGKAIAEELKGAL